MKTCLLMLALPLAVACMRDEQPTVDAAQADAAPAQAAQATPPESPAPAQPAQPAPATAAAPAPSVAVAAAAPADVAAANNDFGARLFKQLAAEPGKNVFISPLSISLALAMTYNGAQDATRDAMAATLGMGGMSLDAVNTGFSRLAAETISKDSAARLAIANSLWARQDIAFRKDFLERTTMHYDARIEPVNFMSPGALGTINGWVREKTMGRIDNLVKADDLTPDTLLILINAIYFKGVWQTQFDKANTADKPFTLDDASVKNVPMMDRRGEFDYAETPLFQAVRLPYGDGRLAMQVFLPRQGTTLASLCARLSGAAWRDWLAGLRNRKGHLALPRFKMEYEAELNEPLTTLGMGIAFSRTAADFKGMADIHERICIDKVRHKSFVEVNEEGTEAAAATSVGMMRVTSVMPEQPPFEMIVDRPFLFAIADTQTGALVFLGALYQP